MRPPQSWNRAKVTLGLAAATALAWVVAALLGQSEAAAIWGGFIPIRLSGVGGDEMLAPVWLTPLTATFVHAGIVHLAMNLLVFTFCGRSVENILGPGAMVALYLVGAYLAAAAEYLAGPNGVTPMVGASGAVSAVIGAYAMLFGRNRVKVANPTLAFWLNALWLAAAFILLQLIVGLTFETSGMRIAVFAHIGGFIAGLILTRPLLLWRYRKA